MKPKEYHITREVARTGMSVVHEAYANTLLGRRRYAIKEVQYDPSQRTTRLLTGSLTEDEERRQLMTFLHFQ